ncbi:hypothetical protein P421_13980 [Heyndrickxia coagulans P38]|nr:hypothetical protein P421_13980 [Heyndrickxia coagulans P38]
MKRSPPGNIERSLHRQLMEYFSARRENLLVTYDKANNTENGIREIEGSEIVRIQSAVQAGQVILKRESRRFRADSPAAVCPLFHGCARFRV